MTDVALKAVLTDKLKKCPHVRFAALAAHAQTAGRRGLALKLLEEETSPSRQVRRVPGPLLILVMRLVLQLRPHLVLVPAVSHNNIVNTVFNPTGFAATALL